MEEFYGRKIVSYWYSEDLSVVVLCVNVQEGFVALFAGTSAEYLIFSILHQ